MKRQFLKTAGFVVSVIVLSSAYIAVRAQQSPTTSVKPVATTNWIGYLVVGQNDAADRIAIGPSPTVNRQVEIGLGSDGILVWRKSNSNQ